MMLMDRGAPGRGHRTAHARAIDAHAPVRRSLAGMTTVDEVLHAVADGFCAVVDAGRCSVYLRDRESGTFRGRVARAGADVDAAVRRLTAGVDADGFTREIVAADEPVAIDDVRVDPRPVRSTMRAWDVRSMLGVALRCDDDVIGLVFVDDEATARRFDAADRAAAGAFAELAAGSITQALTLDAARERLRAATARSRALKHVIAADDALFAVAVGGGDAGAIVAAVAERTRKPVLLIDPAGRRLAGTGAGMLDLAQPNEREELTEAAILPAEPATGRPHRVLAVPVAAAGSHLGRLLVYELGTALTTIDRHVARRAAALIALDLAAAGRVVAAARDSRATFVGDLLRGDRSSTWLERRAREVGLNLASEQVVCLVHPAAAEQDPSVFAARLSGRLDGAAVAAAHVGDALACLVALTPGARDGDVRSAVDDVLADGPGDAVAALSERWSGAAAAARAYEQADQVLRCRRTLGDTCAPRVLDARDLGAGRIFLASVDRREADRFADRALGPLLGTGVAPELVETVGAFLAGGRSVRRAATELDVHENTIRYRLAKVLELTGLDVAADSEDQLTAQLALRVLQLRGRCAWPAPAARPEPVANLALAG